MPDDDVEDIRRRWIGQAHEARETARRTLISLPPGVSNTNCRNVAPDVVDAHRAVLDYATHVEPKQRKVSELWEEPLHRLEVPERGQTVDVGFTGLYGNINFDEIDVETELEFTEIAVSLDRLEWFSSRNEITYELVARSRQYGRVTRQRVDRIHLPPAALRQVFAQLDKCLERLGWVPEAAEKDLKAEVL